MRNSMLVVSYLMLAGSGALVFLGMPSSSLLSQGGRIIVAAWGGFCLVGGMSGLAGMITGRHLLEVVGTALGGTANLTWCASLILQALSTRNTLPLTAACMTASLAAMFAARWAEVVGTRER